MKNQADYSKYKCPYAHIDKECGHELIGPEGYDAKTTWGVWCACGYRGPAFILDPNDLKLALKVENKMQEKNEIYINWDEAPEGTTHIYADVDTIINGIPKFPQAWEKWQDGIIFDWNGSAWGRYERISDMANADLAKRIPIHKSKLINVNEYWFIKLPASPSLIEAKIIDLTEKTVLIQDVNNGNQNRYAISDIEWIEKAVN